MTATVTYPDIEVQLAGRDGNAFAIIAAISAAIRDAVSPEAAKTYRAEAMSQPSYDDLLRHAARTVVTL